MTEEFNQDEELEITEEDFALEDLPTDAAEVEERDIMDQVLESADEDKVDEFIEIANNMDTYLYNTLLFELDEDGSYTPEEIADYIYQNREDVWEMMRRAKQKFKNFEGSEDDLWKTRVAFAKEILKELDPEHFERLQDPIGF